MAGTWHLYQAGSSIATLSILGRGSLAGEISGRLLEGRGGSATGATGDLRYAATPVRLRGYVKASDHEAALDELRSIRAAAEAADELRWVDGATYLSRPGRVLRIETDLSRLGVGHVAYTLVWGPTGPYWVDDTGAEVMLP